MVLNFIKNSKIGHIQILQYNLSIEIKFSICVWKSAPLMSTYSRCRNQANKEKYNNQYMKFKFKTTEKKNRYKFQRLKITKILWHEKPNPPDTWHILEEIPHKKFSETLPRISGQLVIIF